MNEKLIEHWLTNVNELGYQIPLCEVLLAEGYSVLHVSRHGRGEHGKDIVARDPAGRLTTFQLKGGDIGLAEWRAIRGEIEELVQLPVMLPGISAGERHQPILVTNGELKGDAILSLREFAQVWEAKGFPLIEVWQKPQVLKKFVSAHGAYVPSSRLTDFREFVELYVAEGTERLDRRKFSRFVFSLYPNEGTPTQLKRALESAVLMGAYVISQYERSENHVAAMEAWTILASLVLYAAERDNLPSESYGGTLQLLQQSFEASSERFLKEVLNSRDFISNVFMLAEDSEVRGSRTLLVLGWVAGLCLRARMLQRDWPDLKAVRVLLRRELKHIRIFTEADWPAFVSVALFISWHENASTGEFFLHRWVDAILLANRGDHSVGMPSPYWLQDRALALAYGQIPPAEQEEFRGQTYTLLPAIEMLVRRLCRQAVAAYWRPMSRLSHCEFRPQTGADWFLWRTQHGDARIVTLPPTRSWRAWRTEVDRVSLAGFPTALISNLSWLLPFGLVFPHRANRQWVGVVDAIVAGRADLE